MATYFPSHKPFTLDKQDMLGTTGEVRTNSLTTISYSFLLMEKLQFPQLCLDTECHLEDLPIETDGKREKVIHAIHTIMMMMIIRNLNSYIRIGWENLFVITPT